MSDPPGLPSALGIEAVEWFAQEGGGENLTVRVTGRWRRRRPASTAQPTLVVEVHGYRHRYPAMPEPPSLTGTAPGTWRMTFSVPAWIAPYLATRASLQLGGVVIPLPAQIEHTAGEAPSPEMGADAGAAGDEVRELELLVQAARRRAREAEDRAADFDRRIRALEGELQRAGEEPARLRFELAERERALRSAEQRAHAEQRLREDTQVELAQRIRELGDAEGPPTELAAALERVRELEAELAGARRALDEAEHLAAAARADRERVEPPAPDQDQPPEGDEPPRREERVSLGIRGELAVAMRTPSAPRARTPAEGGPAPDALERERAMIEARSVSPSAVEAELGASLVALRHELEDRRAELDERRAELDDLRGVAERERAGHERERAGHERARARVAQLEGELHGYATRCRRAYEAIEQLRKQIEEMWLAAVAAVAPPEPAPAGTVEASPPAPAEPVDASPTVAGPVEAARLEAALSRLREATPEPAGEPGDEAGAEAAVPSPASRPWLAPVLRGMLERDASAAGRLVIALLPAQRLVEQGPVSYDLMLAEDGCVQVTVSGTDARIERGESLRPAEAVRFSLTTDLPGLARFVATGKARPGLLRRSYARVGGDRDAARALTRLVSVPLSVSELIAAGVVLDPPLTLSVVALMIEPAWTVGERFALAYRPLAAAPSEIQAHLAVRDGAAAAAGEGPPADALATTIACAPEDLLAVLDGAIVAGAEIGPDLRPLTLVRNWMKRAQSG
ncbi:MAG TPA: hypothetical protein VMU39_21135 [Solirubrobacteraceae bacterium]|nr:hypothetical protein [Solirubrobacteraceae bacterium]